MAIPGGNASVTLGFQAQWLNPEFFPQARAEILRTDAAMGQLSRGVGGFNRQVDSSNRTLMSMRVALNGVFRALDLVTKGNEDWNRVIRSTQAGIQAAMGVMQLFLFIARQLKTTEWGRAAAQTAAGGIAAPAIAGAIVAGVGMVAAAQAFTGGFGKGGTVFADKPTLALFGEAGPERADFTPLTAPTSSSGFPSVGDVYMTIKSTGSDAVGKSHQRWLRGLKEAGRVS